MTGQRILVLGGTRFIGPYVVRRLHELGHTVSVFHRGQNEAPLPQDVRHIHGDRVELTKYRSEFEEFRPRVVLDMMPLCARDAELVVRTFSGIADRLVAISSQDVYRAYGRLIGTEPGLPDPVPLTEESPLRERLYPYRGDTPRAEDDPRRWMDNYDKIPMERVVLNNEALAGTVLRLPAVYGPGDQQHRVYEYLEKMDTGQDEILVDEALGQWHWTRGYVENVAAAIVLAVADERARGRVYNVGEARALTTTEWIGAIGRAAVWHGEVVTAPAAELAPELAAGMNTAQDLVADTSRLREELGFIELVGLNESLRRTVSWEREDARARKGDDQVGVNHAGVNPGGEKEY